MAKLFTEFNETKWEQVRTHPYYAPAIAALTVKTEELLQTEPPRIKFSDIHLFAVTGERKTFERVYNEYSTRMNNYFFMYCLTKDEKYLTPLADVIWNICDFESWSIPAHVKEDLSPEMRRVNLDLCSTVMGFRIAEILHFIGDKLPDLVYRRALHEVRKRVIDSYAVNDYWWMTKTNNWSAVCIACTLAAYLYVGTKEETDKQLPRMLETINCYLSGINDDGCCMEGYGYWQYGFSHFCLFATMLREYTDGKINLFDNPKVHAIAHFSENITINDSQIIGFSDSHPDVFAPPDWLLHFLKKEYPDLELPSFSHSIAKTGVLRHWLWADPEFANSTLYPKSTMFKDSQWFIYRSEAYNFACKGGHNSEPHNHNDIGSFVISKNGRVTFSDPGTGEYTRQYFAAERYTILEPSSRAHSVPIINGQYQVTGKTKSTVFRAETGHYAYSIDNGYDIATLTALTRAFDCEPDCIRMTDTCTFTEMPAQFTERFVSLTEPKLTENGVCCGETLLVFDPNVFAVELRSEHRIRAGKEAEPVYFTDLTVKNPQKHMCLTVEFR